MSRTLAIVNPVSRGGAARRRWPKLEQSLRDALGPLEVEFTRCSRDAERIAREAVRAGFELLIAAGGDGTTSQVVEGLLGAGLGEYAEVAPLPLGTGGDFSRGLGIDRDLEVTIERIAGGKCRRIDVGLAHFRRPDGSAARTHFVNIASFGISGLVTALVNEAPKSLGGRASFLIGTVRGILAWRSVSVTLRVDDRPVHEGPLDLGVVANGPWFGGGMHVAPEALHDDGLFDVLTVQGASKARLLRRFPLIYSGRHLDLPEVSLQRGDRVEATSDGEVRIELDGEPLGLLPARFELLPGALRLRGVEG